MLFLLSQSPFKISSPSMEEDVANQMESGPWDYAPKLYDGHH
jgi:hypothetical protein